MSKFKKISMAVVATVMAGAMMVPLAACGGGGGGGGGGDDAYKPKVDEAGKLTYSDNIEIKTAIGYDNSERGIKYNLKIMGAMQGQDSANNVTFAGKNYNDGNLKPAWQALQSALKITVKDDWGGSTAGEVNEKAATNIEYVKTVRGGLDKYGIMTSSASSITKEAARGTLLNLNEYLDYMPNYKAFLESSDIVRLSVTQTTTGSNAGAMYMAPYFDGNDDIEKYVLMRKDIVEKVLDATDLSGATTTFKAQAEKKDKAATGATNLVSTVGTSASVSSFMGKTASEKYTIAVTDPAALDTNTIRYGYNSTAVKEGHEKDTVNVVVDYGKVIEALQNSNSDLYKAVKEALKVDTAVQVASGNIIDIQNQIINDSQGECTGAQLTKVLQEYIKVAYHKDGSNDAFYTKLSDVFNSAYAAWDVDLYVALGRCLVTSTGLMGDSAKSDISQVYFLGNREAKLSRVYNAACLAGELYGVRGLCSRYSNQFAYIDADGTIKDARAGTEMWEALNNLSKMAKEGLYYTGASLNGDKGSIANNTTNNKVQFFSSSDYVQTQTGKGGFAVDGKITSNPIESGYNYAPILTPVSRWDTDGNTNNGHETVMRFTENWRGVKDGGLCVSKEYVKNQPEKLSAILSLLDWMYSNDGQMVLTYGPYSSHGDVSVEEGKVANDTYGTWYANPVTGNITGDNGSVSATASMADLKAAGIVDTYDGEMYHVTEKYEGKYLCYNNKLYTGYLYAGKQVPVPTAEMMNMLYTLKGKEGNFSDVARWAVGSALNFGNKDQGFEAQCTAQCGLAGAEIWAIAKVNGTIKHTEQKIDSNRWWYTLVPTVLPFENAETNSMNGTFALLGYSDKLASNYFYQSSNTANFLSDVMYYGYGSGVTISAGAGGTMPATAADFKNFLNTCVEGQTTALDTINGFMRNAWNRSKTYYTEVLNKAD